MKNNFNINNLPVKLGALLAFSMPYFAFAKDDVGAIGVIHRLTSTTGAAGPLATIIACVIGMFCLVKMITTFMNHGENKREHPLSTVLWNFLGAAIGLGYVVASTNVVQTLFGDVNDAVVTDDVFKVDIK